MSEKTIADQPIFCPACGFSALDTMLPEGIIPQSANDLTRLERPTTYDQWLDVFDVLGADDGYMWCPRCKCQFNPKTGAWDGGNYSDASENMPEQQRLFT